MTKREPFWHWRESRLSRCETCGVVTYTLGQDEPSCVVCEVLATRYEIISIEQLTALRQSGLTLDLTRSLDSASTVRQGPDRESPDDGRVGHPSDKGYPHPVDK